MFFYIFQEKNCLQKTKPPLSGLFFSRFFPESLVLLISWVLINLCFEFYILSSFQVGGTGSVTRVKFFYDIIVFFIMRLDIAVLMR